MMKGFFAEGQKETMKKNYALEHSSATSGEVDRKKVLHNLHQKVVRDSGCPNWDTHALSTLTRQGA